ncbi:MAG: FG-GAP repeat protein, partial [Planctomycetes bacterium]|nr:FG-GAP repeat protein [Planctomycetota bacterium]
MRQLPQILISALSVVLMTTSTYADFGDQLFKLLADDGEPFDNFGQSIAISGDTALIGAWGNDDNG